MKKKNILGLLLTCCLLVTGCTEKTAPPEQAEESFVYGQMDTGKLETQAWDSNRCAVTSGYTMAETETGYYLLDHCFLYYADKTDLGTWVPVCIQPACDHTNVECDAHMGGDSFYIRDDRIWFLESVFRFGQLKERGHGVVLASMRPNGTDRRVEYVLEEAISTLEGGSKSLLTPEYWLCRTEELDQHGNETIRMFCVTEHGQQEFPAEFGSKQNNHEILWAQELLQIYGDPYFFSVDLGTDPSFLSGSIFQMKDDKLVSMDLSNIIKDEEYTGMYLSGNVLRLFRRNDGYYDRNLTTGKEIKIGDQYIKNSNAFLLYPNCILETTLHVTTIPYRNQRMAHKMGLFDGEKWNTVELPKELRKAPQGAYVQICAVTSDSIFLRYYEGSSVYEEPMLYRILLNENKLVMESAM